MTASLAKRLDDLIHSALDDYPGSFIVMTRSKEMDRLAEVIAQARREVQ